MRTIEEECSVAERRGFIFNNSFVFHPENIPGVKNIPRSTSRNIETQQVQDPIQSGMLVRVPQCSLKRYVRYQFLILSYVRCILIFFKKL